MVRVSLSLVALTAGLAHGEPTVDLEALDVDVEALACHGPPEHQPISYAVACSQAEGALSSGDHLLLHQSVEIMRHHDPQGARSCTARYDEVLAGIDLRERGDYRAGLAAMKAGELGRARACFRLAVARDPFNQVAARRLGEVEAAMQRPAAEAAAPGQAPPGDPAPSAEE